MQKKVLFFTTLGFIVIGSGTAATVILVGNKSTTDKNLLTADKFEFTGTAFSGKVAVKSGVALPQWAEVKYAPPSKKASTPEPPDSDEDYMPLSQKIPSLKNNDKVFVKYFVKSGAPKDFKLSASLTKPLMLTIKGLDKFEVDGKDFFTLDFLNVSKKNGSGQVIWQNDAMPRHMTGKLEVKYAKAPSAPADSAYQTTSPADLKNGDKVFVKLFVKPVAKDNFKLSASLTNPLELTVSGL